MGSASHDHHLRRSKGKAATEEMRRKEMQLRQELASDTYVKENAKKCPECNMVRRLKCLTRLRHLTIADTDVESSAAISGSRIRLRFQLHQPLHHAHVTLPGVVGAAKTAGDREERGVQQDDVSQLRGMYNTCLRRPLSR